MFALGLTGLACPAASGARRFNAEFDTVRPHFRIRAFCVVQLPRRSSDSPRGLEIYRIFALPPNGGELNRSVPAAAARSAGLARNRTPQSPAVECRVPFELILAVDEAVPHPEVERISARSSAQRRSIGHYLRLHLAPVLHQRPLLRILRRATPDVADFVHAREVAAPARRRRGKVTVAREQHRRDGGDEGAFHAASPKIARDVVSQDFSFNHRDLNHWLDDRPNADATAEPGLFV